MKYHSRPKPVRIRIESGGEEHFSLDSLLNCLDPKDIILRKQELIRWLSTQGERGMQIVDRINPIVFCRKNLYQIYKAFFPDMEANKLVEMYAVWKTSNQYSRNFQFLKSYCLSDGSTIEQLYSAKETRGSEDWFSVIQNFVQEKYLKGRLSNEIPYFKEPVDHPILFYHLGCMYKEQKNDTKQALICLDIASKYGNELIKKNVNRYINKKMLLPSLQDLVDYCYKNYYKFNGKADESIRVFCHTNNVTNLYNAAALTPIINFVLKCYLTKTYSPNDITDKYPNLVSPRYKFAGSIFAYSKVSPLYQLELFVLLIIQYDENEPRTAHQRADDKLKILAETYYPAKYFIYEKEKDSFLDENSFRRLTTTEKIDFIIGHITYFLPDNIKEELEIYERIQKRQTDERKYYQ